MDKQYYPVEIEEKWSKIWSERVISNKDSDISFSQVIPPPNVTGTLHMGHSFQYAIMDFYTRYHHMSGKDAHWQVGADHAGIATQMVVENNLAKNDVTRLELGREKFLDEVWSWKDYSEEKITSQIKRLGCSVDWNKYRFTLDDGCNEAVIKAFVELHRKNKIYRGYRLVNWDPSLKTAVSDLEVIRQEKDGLLWHIKYPIEDSDDFVIVATTRPETMFGDMAVAVNPNDDRYKNLIGKNIVLPFVGRKIPILADEYVDMEFGTGCLKITPGHDFNDYEIGKKYSLHEVEGQVKTSDNASDFEPINIFNEDAWSNENVPEPFSNLDRFKVRKAVLEKLKELNLLDREEKHHISVPRGERSNIVIEPRLSYQWYVKTEEMAARANEAVNKGEIKFHPGNWVKTYFNWMNNIEDWCISRQIWWGHRIPAWYGPDGQVFVEANEDEAVASASKHYGKAVELTRDNDVLDTWFSSGLWPFSTLGWPDNTAELKRYYPGDVLVTGFDIIFFWVARMMMMGMHFMDGEVPFREVYIHALVRDEKGQKMSKSKGNVLDPLELIDQYGADSLRFTLAAMAAQGRDIKMSTTRLEGYRNFTTKIWNACRFLQMNGCTGSAAIDLSSVKEPINKWIVSEYSDAIEKTTKAIELYRFNEAADALYHFIWNSYCNWYVELIKPSLNDDDANAAAETRATASTILEGTLRLLHPFMPFLTEELNREIFASDDLLIAAQWPEPVKADEGSAVIELRFLIQLITEIRYIRAEMNVPLSAKPVLHLRGITDLHQRAIDNQKAALLRLARLDGIAPVDSFAKGSARGSVDGMEIGLPLADILDLTAEAARLNKEIGGVTAEIEKISRKLDNPGFIAKAPEDVVAENRRRLDEENTRLNGLTAALKRLG